MQSIRELAAGQRLGVRIDINAPVENGQVQDHRRFTAISRRMPRVEEAGS